MDDDKGTVSELRVMQSAAGYYVGTSFIHENGWQEPNSRDSGYFRTAEGAEKELKSMKNEI